MSTPEIVIDNLYKILRDKLHSKFCKSFQYRVVYSNDVITLSASYTGSADSFEKLYADMSQNINEVNVVLISAISILESEKYLNTGIKSSVNLITREFCSELDDFCNEHSYYFTLKELKSSIIIYLE